MRAIIPADLPDDLREELATTYRHDVSAHTAALMKALREYAEKEGYCLATVEDLRSVWIISAPYTRRGEASQVTINYLEENK